MSFNLGGCDATYVFYMLYVKDDVIISPSKALIDCGNIKFVCVNE